LPDLTLKNEKDEDIQVADIASENGAVIFLVPKADTREFGPIPLGLKTVAEGPFFFVLIAGCTTQACGFRDIFADFTAVNYAVYCLSADPPSAQTKWQSKARPPRSCSIET
jgi:peroxiredoxin Q/BCP